MKRLGLTLALLSSPALAGTVVFERVEPVEVRTGVMRLRTVQAPLLEVPDLKATAWREDRFARLYAIDFELETRGRDRSQVEERGTLLLAVRTQSDALVELDERIRSLLGSLGADAFAEPLAGIRGGTPDFLGLAEISEEPSWVCSAGGGRGSLGSTTMFHRQVEKGADGERKVVGTSSASSGLAERSRRMCDSFRLAAQGAVAEELRTLPAPRQLHELAVEMEETDTLPSEIRREDLPSLPSGVELSTKRAPGVWSGASFSPDGSFSTYVDREIEWSARTVPSALSPDLLARGAHVSRWRVRERERRLGVTPRDEVRTTAVRTVAFLPIAPAPLPEETLPTTLPVRFDAELLREDMAHALDAGSSVDASALEEALLGGRGLGPEWLRSQAWMIVVCRDDGTAWFGLPPTGVQSPVTNASLICAALERMLR